MLRELGGPSLPFPPGGPPALGRHGGAGLDGAARGRLRGAARRGGRPPPAVALRLRVPVRGGAAPRRTPPAAGRDLPPTGRLRPQRPQGTWRPGRGAGWEAPPRGAGHRLSPPKEGRGARSANASRGPVMALFAFVFVFN